jgi:FkbM family methyltransferase
VKARHYERVLRNFSDDEEPDLKVVRHLVAPGTTAVDLGANIGVYTKVLSSLVGAGGRVISVEPVPQTFRFLVANVGALGLANVEVVNAAVSDGRHELTMEVPAYESGGENFYAAQVVTDGGIRERRSDNRLLHVRAVTLDEIVSPVERLAFVKCDVEGHEMSCLLGAGVTLSRHRPAWLIEVWGDPDAVDSSAATVFSHLEAHGYLAWLFDGTHLVKRRTGDRGTNYFFLSGSHISAIERAAPGLLA